MPPGLFIGRGLRSCNKHQTTINELAVKTPCLGSAICQGRLCGPEPDRRDITDLVAEGWCGAEGRDFGIPVLGVGNPKRVQASYRRSDEIDLSGLPSPNRTNQQNELTVPLAADQV